MKLDILSRGKEKVIGCQMKGGGCVGVALVILILNTFQEAQSSILDGQMTAKPAIHLQYGTIGPGNEFRYNAPSNGLKMVDSPSLLGHWHEW